MMFDKVDSNGDGGIDQNELKILAERISARTGSSINVDDTSSAYDTDDDLELLILLFFDLKKEILSDS